MSFRAPKADLYWRLTTSGQCKETKQQLADRLVKAGYEVKKSLNHDELFQLVQRMELGGLCYDKFTQLELKQCAVDRGLVAANKSPTKRWLVDRLMGADKRRTFSKFVELPPELRKTIYEFYLTDFQGRVLQLPAQPPLARTCQLLRSEVLPLFYSTYEFQLQYRSISTSDFTKVRFRLYDTSYIFLTTLAPGCIGDLRKLELSFYDKGIYPDWQKCKFKVNLTDSNKICRIMKGYPTRCDEDDDIDWGAFLKNGLKGELKKVSQRSGVGKLEMEDFYALAKAMERGVEDACKPPIPSD